MTIDEAIKHAEEIIVEMSYEFQESVALQDHENAKLCRECAEEHRQLAEWLKDYKRLLEQEPSGDLISRQADNLCSSCTNIGCEFQSGIVRTKCAFYMPPHIESDNCGNYVVMQPVNPQEPKTGHWEIIPCGNNHGEYRPPKYMCSECGWEIDFCRGLQQDTGHRLFCEHCGAKMFEP